MAKKRSAKKWIQKAITRPGALRKYAKAHGGLTKDGRISRSWAESLAASLHKKEKKTAAETRLLRQLNLYLHQLSGMARKK